MRLLRVPAVSLAYLLLAGCASSPNQPTQILQTSKTPEQYAECVVPKLRDRTQTPILTQSQRHYRIVVSSTLAADNIIEAYKAPTGGKVFLYERTLMASSFNKAVQACL